MARRHKRRSATSSIVKDTVSIGARLPWWGALLLGCFSFVFFYFLAPAWLEIQLVGLEQNRFHQVLEGVFGRQFHRFQWLGIACGLVGLYFCLRNYIAISSADTREQGIVSALARLLGRNIE